MTAARALPYLNSDHLSREAFGGIPDQTVALHDIVAVRHPGVRAVEGVRVWMMVRIKTPHKFASNELEGRVKILGFLLSEKRAGE